MEWQSKLAQYRADIFSNSLSKNGIACIEIVVHEDPRRSQSMLDDDNA